MSHTVGIAELDRKLAKLISDLRPGEEITVVRDNEPVAKIVPQSAPRRRAGACKGMLIENPDVPEDAYLEDFKDYL
jgi:antitoxin (DNA-binding transcriptional repressor) of toxin-antitoxin stability system